MHGSQEKKGISLQNVSAFSSLFGCVLNPQFVTPQLITCIMHLDLEQQELLLRPCIFLP